MNELPKSVTHKICPSCKKEYHRDVFGYQIGNYGEKKCKPYCPTCKKEKNAVLTKKNKNKSDPFYCGF